MPVQTSAEYARRRLSGDDVPDAISGADPVWLDVTGRSPQGEGLEPAHELVFGAGARLRDIAAQPPEPGGLVAEHSRFGELAVTVWQPLLTAERTDRVRPSSGTGARP